MKSHRSEAVSPKRVKILLADDHSIVRSGLRSLFKESPEFVVVGEARNGKEAVELAGKLKPDVVILDISMPELNGIEATRQIKEGMPEVKVLILTIHENEEYVYEMIRAGANGYVLKDAEKQEIFSALRTVMAAEPFFSPGVSRLIIEKFVKRAKQPPSTRTAPHSNLSKREEDVLRLIAQGLTGKEIAEKLYLSASTINTHRANLMQKLDIHDTATLVRFAIAQGIVDAES